MKSILSTILFSMLLVLGANANIYIVTNSNDSGAGSLRDAINQANVNPDSDEIQFNIPGTGPHEILLLSPLPFLGHVININGYTQPGSIEASYLTPAVLKIALNGTAAGVAAAGLTLGNYCIVTGLAVYGFDIEINIAGNDNRVSGCHFGLDATGMNSIGNAFNRMIINGDLNLVGGGIPKARNVIAGSNNGIAVFPDASNNIIIGNYIGTDATGNHTLPDNGFDGIAISSNTNLIASNVIVGYGSNNILISRWNDDVPFPQGNVLQYNTIGCHADGSFSSFANNCQGISINNAANTTVRFNTIYGNGCHGVLIDGDAATGNLVSQNSIYGNNGIAINLGLDWVTTNDPGDGDTGPNQLLNYPVLLGAKTRPYLTKVKGYIDTPNPNTVRVEFYANPAPHATGHGDGQTLIGFTIPKSNGKIRANLAPVAPGTYISAIAIDNENNTSEFSWSIEATSPGGGSGNNLAANLSNAIILEEALEVQVNAFPNPFFSETTIAYELPKSQEVKLSIFDASGQLIQVLNESYQEEGTYRMRFDATQLPAGVYFYHLVTDGEVLTGKIISE